MAHYLRSNLHYCDTGAHIVFLDVAAGRYFSIPPSWNVTFHNSLAGDVPAEQADIPTGKLVAAGILCEAKDAGPTRDQEPFVAPTQIWAGQAERALRVSTVLRALWHQMRVASDLKRHGFQYVIRDLERRRRSPFCTALVDVATQVNSFSVAFTFAEFAISKADNCLIRSIAFLRMLRAAGTDGVLVIGVTASPFSAHAWVQRGAVLLNDSLDRVRIFSPILVV